MYERASALFGDIFQDQDGKIQVGVDYVGADRTPGTETDGRFGVTLSTKVNDRISINGKVGVPVGGINESAIVGNVEVQYRVNEDGTLNLRVFNKETDINYIGQGIGYTQGVGVSYEVDFDNLKELINKIFKRVDKKVTEKKPDEDSNLLPNFIIIEGEKKSKEKYKEEIKNNKEAVPLED